MYTVELRELELHHEIEKMDQDIGAFDNSNFHRKKVEFVKRSVSLMTRGSFTLLRLKFTGERNLKKKIISIFLSSSS